MNSKHERASAPEGAALAPFDPESRVTLEWKQPKAWTMTHELTDGQRVFARVSTTGFWSNRRTVEFAHASWEVRETAFGDLVIDGAEGRRGAPYLRYRSGFVTGKFERAGQPTLRVHTGGFWNPWWELRDDEDQPLVHLAVSSGFTRTKAKLTVFDAARRLADLPALLGLAMHASLAAQRRRSHAAV